MQEKVKDAPGSEFKWVGTRPDRPGRRRQGDGPRPVRRRSRHGRPARRQGAAEARIRTRASARSTPARREKLPGVKAIVTGMDFKDQPSEFIPAGEMMINYKDVVRNVMAREKALYEGHPSPPWPPPAPSIAKQALKLIKVDYEVLPHVIDVVEAMQPGAPLLHEDMFTAGVEPAPKTPSNVAKRVEFVLGDVAAGFKQADLVVERDVHHQAGAPGLHRAARLRRQRVGGRPGRRVGDDAGPLDRARPLRPAARLGRRQGARHLLGDRRRLRRQDRGLPRADGAGALQEVAAVP